MDGGGEIKCVCVCVCVCGQLELMLWLETVVDRPTADATRTVASSSSRVQNANSWMEHTSYLVRACVHVCACVCVCGIIGMV